MQKEYSMGRWSSISHFLYADTRIAPFWLIVRLYVGWEWFMAGWGKMMNPKWFGTDAGAAISGFMKGAVAKASCPPDVAAAACHVDVQWWYASFLENFVIPYPFFWSHLITLGEVLVGVALLAGFLTGISAFFGAFMNLNFLLAGTVSVNPILIILGIGLVTAWKVSGHIGLDRYILPMIERCCNRAHKDKTT
jgi:thiosulfate dehydrogenase [quinone] large subunit